MLLFIILRIITVNTHIELVFEGNIFIFKLLSSKVNKLKLCLQFEVNFEQILLFLKSNYEMFSVFRMNISNKVILRIIKNFSVYLILQN